MGQFEISQLRENFKHSLPQSNSTLEKILIGAKTISPAKKHSPIWSQSEVI